MARLEFPDPAVSGDIERLAAEIQQERGGQLPNLFRMQLHSPPLAAAWVQLGTAIRYQAKLEGRLRELVICLVARLSGADYEWHHHQPLALREGISAEQLEALPNWRGSGRFDARERAALAYAEQMTQRIDVDDITFAATREQLDPREIVELTATVAYYGMVARFLVALQVDIDE